MDYLFRYFDNNDAETAIICDKNDKSKRILNQQSTNRNIICSKASENYKFPINAFDCFKQIINQTK